MNISIKNGTMKSIVEAMKPLSKKGVRAAIHVGPDVTDEQIKAFITVVNDNGTEQLSRAFYASKPSDYKDGDKEVYIVPSDTFVSVTDSLLAYDEDISFIRKDGGLFVASGKKASVKVPTIDKNVVPISCNAKDAVITMELTSEEEVSAFAAALKKGSAASEDTQNDLHNTIPIVFRDDAVQVYSTDGTWITSIKAKAKIKKIEENVSEYAPDGVLLFPLPCSVIKALTTTLSGKVRVGIAFCKKHLLLQYKGGQYICSLAAKKVDAAVKMYDQLDKSLIDASATLDSDELSKALTVSSLEGGGDTNIEVSFDMDHSQIVLKTGISLISVSATQISGRNVSATYKAALLKSVLSILPKGNVTISFSSMKDNYLLALHAGIASTLDADKAFILPVAKKAVSEE